VFMELIRRRMPKLAAHLTELGVSVEVLTTQWFLCIFLNSLSIGAALRVWDCLMLHGGHVLFQVALALLSMQEEAILRCDSLDSFVEGVGNIASAGDDVEALLKVAFSPEIMGTAFGQEVAQLRRRHRSVMLEEKRHEHRRTFEYREAQRQQATPQSPVASRVHQAHSQAWGVLAEFAQLQHRLAAMSKTLSPCPAHGGAPGTEHRVQGPKLLLAPVGVAQAHVVVFGARGMGMELTRSLARLGVARITLVDDTVAEKADIDRNFLHMEHVGVPLVEGFRECVEALPGPATAVCPVLLDLTHPATQPGLRAVLLQTEGGPATEAVPCPSAVHAVLLCVSSPAALSNVSQVCHSLGRPFVECSVATNGAQGHVHLRLPGAGPCIACAAALPDFIGHAVDPFGDGRAIMFAPSTQQMVAAVAVQRLVQGLHTGDWVPSSCAIDSTSEEGLHTALLQPDKRCPSQECQRGQRFFEFYEQLGWPMMPAVCSQPERWASPAELCEAEDEVLVEALGYTLEQVHDMKACFKLF